LQNRRLILLRIPVALVWFYQGLWNKVLGRAPHEEHIVGSLPFLTPSAAHALFFSIGAVECVLAVWVLSGWRPKLAAWAQITLLVVMNAGGLLWGRQFIPDAAGLIIQNLAFIALIVVVAQEGSRAAGRI
jgi:uncharacterized membrane protein YphA (DoxX/SURF4 family)